MSSLINTTETATGTATTAQPENGTTIVQYLGTLLLFVTIAWSIYANIDNLGTFRVMYEELIINGSNYKGGKMFANSFVVGLGAIPFYVFGLIFRRGAPPNRVVPWATIALFVSVLAFLFWFIVIIGFAFMQRFGLF